MKRFMTALTLGFIEAIPFVYFYVCYHWWHDTTVPMDMCLYLLFVYTIWIAVILYFGKLRKTTPTKPTDKKVKND